MNMIVTRQRKLLCKLALLLARTVLADTVEHDDNGRLADQELNNTSWNISSTVLLTDGNPIPMVGLGLALTAETSYNAIHWAFDTGYRLLDTAAEESYGNEDQVGKAILDYSDKLSRDEIFVTTKLWDDSHGFWDTLEAFDESYETLNIGTIDLYLVHSPFGGRLVETWDALLYVQSKGYVKSIGVSNFGLSHLQVLLDHGRPLPAVNQIEMHPLVYRKRAPLLKWCQEHGVRIQAYGSLMHGYDEWLKDSDLLKELGTRYHKSTSHILLRWALQHGFLIIPKSARRERIIDNSLLFDFSLSDEDMARLDAWGDEVGEERNIYKLDWNWNPIDEAPVHSGRTDFWPNYEGVDDVYFGDDDEERDEL